MKSGNGKTRLLLAAPLFPPSVGGASELFRILTEVWNQDESVERIVILTERVRRDQPADQEEGKILVHRFLPPTRRLKRRRALFHVVSGLQSYTMLTAAAAWHLRHEKPHLALVHGRFGRKIFLKVLRLFDTKVVVLLSDHFRSPENLADSDAVICITESVYERARSVLAGRCQVYHVPLPLELPRPGRRKIPSADMSEPYFLFVGEVSCWKGADVLLEAFAAFRQDHPDYSLFLAGPVCDRRLTGMDCPGARFLGEVDHETTLGLIEHAEALVLPSRSEGLPRVCLEAIALGTKVICPPGVPELQRACPEWILTDISKEAVLQKFCQAVDFPFHGSFEFERHDPRRVASRILEICGAVLRNGAGVKDNSDRGT